MDQSQAIELYGRLGKTIKEFRDTYWIAQCPNPDHADNNPSCKIGANHPHPFKCWSCGFTGTLAKIAADYGIDVASTWSMNAIQSTKYVKLPDLTTLRLEPWTGSYRGIDEAAWLRFGAIKWWDTYIDKETNEERLGAIRILLPIYVNGMLVSYVGRRIDDSTLLRYTNYKDAAFSQLLYLYDTIQPRWPIALVEGPLDAIRYNLNGIPALAIFGVENWSDYKLRMLLAKSPSTIYLSMDGDSAGQAGQQKLYNRLARYLDTQVIQMPLGVDPFDLDSELLGQIYNMVWSNYNAKMGLANANPQA